MGGRNPCRPILIYLYLGRSGVNYYSDSPWTTSKNTVLITLSAHVLTIAIYSELRPTEGEWCGVKTLQTLEQFSSCNNHGDRRESPGLFWLITDREVYRWETWGIFIEITSSPWDQYGDVGLKRRRNKTDARRSKGADNCSGHVALESCYLFRHISMQQTKRGLGDNWLEAMKMYHAGGEAAEITLP